MVERGTLPGQRTVTAPLSEIAAAVAEEGIRAPAIVVVGRSAALRDTLAWLEHRPLHGRVVAVTRARAQASGLAARLRDLGAEVAETPAIRIEPRPVEGELLEAVSRIREYALVCFTSPNGVRLLFDALEQAGHDARALAGATVAAIGPGTAAELAGRGIAADVVPPRSIAEALAEALVDVPVEGRAVLIARAAEARDVLPDALRDRGALVDDVAVYETVAEPLGRGRAGHPRACHPRDLHLQLHRPLLPRVGRPRARRCPGGVDRAGDERHRRRARGAGGRGGGAPRHRRPARRPSGRRRDRAVIVTLLTDYGRDDEFVGVCHGVIRSIHPDAQIVDVTHGITRYDVRHGAIVLRNTLPYMPVGVHVAVVDPQVGTERRAVALETADGRILVGPDNGLLSLAWERSGGVRLAVDVTRSPHRLEPVSATFHGRDLFAPVAAHLAAGAELADAGDPVEPETLTRLELPAPQGGERDAGGPRPRSPTASATWPSTWITTGSPTPA